MTTKATQINPDAVTHVEKAKGLVQQVYTQDGEYASGTGIIPLDDSVPQITEGNGFLSQSITPLSATSILEIDVVVALSPSAASQHLVAALFQDSITDAIACGAEFESDAGGLVNIKFTHRMIAGATSAMTFKVRCGGQSGTTYFNGYTARIFGGVLSSSISIREIKP